MNSDQLLHVKHNFESAALSWMCELYNIEIRYIATQSDSDIEIIQALVLFYPWSNTERDPELFQFRIQAGNFYIGQHVLQNSTLYEAKDILNEAINGGINYPLFKMKLAAPTGSYHYHRMETGNEWTNMIHMSVSAQEADPIIIPPTIDDDLRRANVPFDGFSDLMQWLSLQDFRHPSGRPSISIVVHPPAQISISDCALTDEKLTVAIEIMPSVHPENVSVAVMGSPPNGVSLRKQLRNSLEWKNQPDKKRICGVCTVNMDGAYMALVALSIGSVYVQRHWFSDPSLSRNIRYTATQEFDTDLRMIKKRLESSDSRVFEKAVAALIFLLGFAPLMMLETDAPDIIAVSPAGQVVLVECTIKTTDAEAKIGNLVARRESLKSAFLRGNFSNPIISLLVCQCERSHIHASDAAIASNDVILLTKEDLTQYVVNAQHPVDADEISAKALTRLVELKPTAG